MLKKFALMFALLVLPAVSFAQEDAPPAPVPADDSASAVVVGSGCNGCGTSVVGTGCNTGCDPCARAPRARVLGRRNSCCPPVVNCCAPAPKCCTPAPVCCTPAPVCAPAPSCCGTVATSCCAPAPRTRIVNRRSNCCETVASATTDCCSTSVATAPVTDGTVAQVSYTSDCCQPTVRTGLRPFSGSVLRRAR